MTSASARQSANSEIRSVASSAEICGSPSGRRHMRHAGSNRLAILNIDTRGIVFLTIDRLGKGLNPQAKAWFRVVS